MRILPIPPSTIEAYGAEQIVCSAPENFELSDGTRPEDVPAMKIGETIHVLVGVEPDERDAFQRTHCFYLSFISGFVPVFQLRVADIFMYEEKIPEEVILVVEDSNLYQEARDSWPYIRGTKYLKFKAFPHEVLFKGVKEESVIKTDELLVHNLQSGNMFVVSVNFICALFGDNYDEPEPQPESEEDNRIELQFNSSFSEAEEDVSDVHDEAAGREFSSGI